MEKRGKQVIFSVIFAFCDKKVAFCDIYRRKDKAGRGPEEPVKISQDTFLHRFCAGRIPYKIIS